MQTFIQEAMRKWAEGTPSIEALFVTGVRVNAAAVKKESDPYEFIVVQEQVEEIVEKEDWFARFASQPIQVGRVSAEEGDRYRILLEDRTRINLCVLSVEEVPALLQKDSLAKVIYDAKNRYADRTESTDLTERVQKPCPKALDLWCQTFYADVTDTALALVDEELLVAQFYFARARRTLIAMNRTAVASDSDFRVNLGRNGENLKAYMNEIAYDHLVRSFSATHRDRIWDAVFQACMLFRKAGLRLNEWAEFTYPKKLDVEMMQFLRKLWEESRA